MLVLSLGALVYSRIVGGELRVAVAPFDAASAHPQSRATARAMAGDISAALSDKQVATIPEERAREYDAGIREGGILMGVNSRTDEDAAHFEEEWRRNRGESVYR